MSTFEEQSGYDLLELVSGGVVDEAWRARERASGEVVTLKRLRPGAQPSAGEALRREATLLSSLDTPYVLRPRRVLGEGQDTVLVLDHAAGSLATLVEQRGPLEPGEVVSVGVPLAEVLSALHARGLVHGSLMLTDVGFTADGMPLLTGLGLARQADSAQDSLGLVEDSRGAPGVGSETPSPADDVWALAAICSHLLAGSPPRQSGAEVGRPGPEAGQAGREAGEPAVRAPLTGAVPAAPRVVAVIDQVLAAEPAGRPDAATFGLALRRAHAPAPVRQTADPAPAADPAAICAADPAAGSAVGSAVGSVTLTSRARRHRSTVSAAARRGRTERPAVLLLCAAVVGLAAAALLGWQLGRGDRAGDASRLAAVGQPSVPAPAGAPASAATSAPDWRAVLDGLDAARAAAFAAGDPHALGAVHAAGSPVLTADTRLLRELAAQGRTARGVRHQLQSVRQLSFDGTTARLRLRDVLVPYEVLGPDGSVLQRRPARASAAFEVVMVRTAQGWRLREVRGA